MHANGTWIGSAETRRRGSSVRALVLLAALLGCAEASDAQDLRYDRDYPAIAYSSQEPTDRLTRWIERVRDGQVPLAATPEHGFLPDVLEQLGVSPSSQMLVFSGTSLQERLIRPATPRAIYFSDDTYVAWVRGADKIELASFDPLLGPVFYTLGEDPDGSPAFERQDETCLECHDSFGLTGGGVPRLLVGSGIPDRAGNIATHGGWILTDHRTPLERRWGGWYVTGTHGVARHRGNLHVERADEVATLDPADGANVTDLSEFLDVSPYLTPHSDIVALLVAEHQFFVQNAIVRTNWDTRSILWEAEQTGDRGRLDERIAEATEPLVQALFLVGEAPLNGPITGTSGFRERFEGEGRRDPQGRSLRDLDLENRLFRYPLSFLIHSGGFRGLPQEARAVAYARVREVLEGRDRSGAFDHIGEADRRAMLEIMKATDPEFAGS